MSATPSTADGAYWDRGYAVAHDLVDAQQLAFVRSAMDVSQRQGRMRFATNVVPQGAMNEYAPIGGETLLIRSLPAFEAITGRDLLPAYAFWRIYEQGAELRRHVDRNACEVSASLPIFAEPADQPWPIHVRDLKGMETEVALEPGSAIIYQGCAIPHWREPFRGRLQYQVFLHYVFKDGDKASYAYDRRDGLKLRLPGPTG
jgi:hypothetical protein